MRRKEHALTALILLTAVFILFFPQIARAAPSEHERVVAAIHFAASEQGLSESKMTRIGQCESGLRENPPGRYGGTFQQDRRFFPARVVEFNKWAKAAGHPTMSGQIGVAIDNARVSARMMATRGFRDWPECGKR